MDSILIRTAEGNDVITITTFNSAMALESEHVALDWAILRAGVAQALADPAKAFYLLAEVAGQPVGQLMVTTEWSDWRNGWIWWIQSVYVKPEHRRRGVFASLYQHLWDMASARGDIRGMRLYVMRDNNIAKRTYESVGMRHSHYDLYETDL
jgi:ribosomal protein S18 acetylase RimI-like enzyme